MPTWDGWDTSLLATLDAPSSGATRGFLADWAKADGTTCNDNPLAATLARGGSRHCKHVSGTVYVQAYSTKANGIDATAAQLGQDAYQPIVAALKSGDPYGYKDWQLVVGSLGAWGAHSYAVEYMKAAQQAQPSAPPPTIATSAGAQGLAGFHHLSVTLARTVPTEIRKAQKLRAAALARLHGRG